MHWLTDDYVTFVTGNAYLLGDLTLLVEFCVLVLFAAARLQDKSCQIRQRLI